MRTKGMSYETLLALIMFAAILLVVLGILAYKITGLNPGTFLTATLYNILGSIFS